MIFNEIYSAYYNTVAKIISEIIKGNNSEKDLNKIVCENAFAESVLTIMPSLKSGKWQLVKSDFTTPIKNQPELPTTTIEKQWLKAISLDPRIKLFDVSFSGLDNVEPLFTSDDYCIYDKYADGDNYENEEYIKIFRTLLTAIKNNQNVKIEMINRKGKTVYTRCSPKRLEYSEKDDKFRVVTSGCRYVSTLNLAKITKCAIDTDNTRPVTDMPETSVETIVLKITDERNTLERCMLHFANFEKRVEKVDDYYLLYMNISCNDELEIVIRVLSFGPNVQVLEPLRFKNLIIDKLKQQKSCELK